MTILLRRFVLIALIGALTATSVGAQQPLALSKRTEEVKAKINKLSPQAHISVIPIRGEEEFGLFLSKDPEHFTFHDIDRKTDVSFRYDEVRKVKEGYGGYNHLRGRHTDHTKAVVVGVVLAGVLVALIAAAAHAD